MAARVIRKAWTVPMLGVDHHGGLYYYNAFTGLGAIPGPPIPHPPGLAPTVPHSWHAVLTFSAWPEGAFGTHKVNDTVIVEGDPIVSKDHSVGHDIHIPPGVNLLWPVTMLFAGSQWKLSVSSVLASKGPVASTIGYFVGWNYNCADPCAGTSLNTMFASATVEVQPSAADFKRAALEMAIQSAIEMFISWLLDRKFMSALWSKLGSRLLGQGIEDLGGKLASALTPAARRAIARKAMEDELHKAILKALLDDTPFAPTAINQIWRESTHGLVKTAEDWIKGAIGDPIKFLVGKGKDAIGDEVGSKDGSDGEPPAEPESR